MNAQYISAVFLIGMFFLVATTSIGSTPSADKVKVGCKDLASDFSIPN
jgi:hypothetical protein